MHVAGSKDRGHSMKKLIVIGVACVGLVFLDESSFAKNTNSCLNQGNWVPIHQAHQFTCDNGNLICYGSFSNSRGTWTNLMGKQGGPYSSCSVPGNPPGSQQYPSLWSCTQVYKASQGCGYNPNTVPGCSKPSHWKMGNNYATCNKPKLNLSYVCLSGGQSGGVVIQNIQTKAYMKPCSGGPTGVVTTPACAACFNKNIK